MFNTVRTGKCIAAFLALSVSSINLSHADDIQRNLEDVKCLAQNIYHEARDQSVVGQIAVAEVTINRAKSGKFPTRICDVVFDKYQFSWTIYKPRIHEKEVYQEIFQLALDMYFQYNPENDGSVYYHAQSVNPDWSRKLKKTKIVGKHIFYKFKE